MPIDMGSIPQGDRQDFEQRLKVYGLDTSAVQEPLVVTGSRVPLAYGPNRESSRSPFVLQTTDFASVKRMIGIDDRVFRTVAPKVTLPGRIDLGTRFGAAERFRMARPGVEREAETDGFSAAPGQRMDDPQSAKAKLSDQILRQLDAEAVTNTRLAARAFVRGNSEIVASFRPIIEAAVGTITIPIWPMLKVTVAAGSVLEFGPGVNVLVAWEIEIEQGGVIRSYGHLTVNCTRLRKPGRAFPLGGIIATTTTAGVFRPIFSAE